ncbi:unnamed protein product [Spirodela intermedia]|uniref:RRM domain-containing protein n=1 Tax=Spirodela intermedia TaxID=51605 RepID=A0A7I8IXN9_SPIIN|nr:unnamed protein product [Spirodela intermedia]CAA6662734.1 unnamed protein product [Spirodela intermedia]
MSRRRGREEEPELDGSYTNAAGPSRKRRRGRRQLLVEEGAADALASTDEVKVGYADQGATDGSGSTVVVVNGLPSDCTVLELKSRMQMYGSIARIRIDDGEGLGYVKYRNPDQARAAIAAAANPVLGITIGTGKVQVYEASEPAPQWQPSTGLSGPSKLLRAEHPLRKYGRGNKLLRSDMQHDGRQIVAYDDIL